jgi:predicted TIM-barrel fold metal-dependent hydrolase
MKNSAPLSRRQFLIAAAASGTTTSKALAAESKEPVIDIHQHTGYLHRADPLLVAHQRKMGVTKTILLPAGSQVIRPSTHEGKSNGLAAKVPGNDAAVALAKKHPGEFYFGVNEVTDLPNAQKVLEKYLKLGAIIIGEQKFMVPCDSEYVWKIAEVAREYNVPMLMHFEHNRYNLGIENFHKTLEKFPDVKFIGHAQTWWGNIDKCHEQTVLYPRTRVTPGGITDQLLSNYPNLYGDLSAGSGLNSMLRDEEHAKEFLTRHQDQLLYGSDCPDADGQSSGCRGHLIMNAVRRLAPCKAIERKILHDNSQKLFKI